MSMPSNAFRLNRRPASRRNRADPTPGSMIRSGDPFSSAQRLNRPSTLSSVAPPEMAMGGNSSTVNNQKTYQLDYTGVSQEEVGILSLFTMQEMKSGG